MFYWEETEKGFVRRRCKVLPSGKFRIVNGEWYRTGEAKAIADEPWCNKSVDWNKGVKNISDGKTYGSKQAYLDSVKRAGGVVVGENTSKAASKRQVQGDFNLRKELTKVTRQVLAKQ